MERHHSDDQDPLLRVGGAEVAEAQVLAAGEEVMSHRDEGGTGERPDQDPANSADQSLDDERPARREHEAGRDRIRDSEPTPAHVPDEEEGQCARAGGDGGYKRGERNGECAGGHGLRAFLVRSKGFLRLGRLHVRIPRPSGARR
jgi:hypothetical protein